MKFLFTLITLIFGVAMNAVNAQVDSFLDKSISSLSINSAGPVNAKAEKSIFMCRARTSIISEEPLLVIDGNVYEMNELQKLNPNDIVSIDILKYDQMKGIFGCNPQHRDVIISTTKPASAKKIIIKDFLSGEKVPFATTYFVSKNDTIQSIADDNGILETNKLKPGMEYKMIVSSAGYKTFSTTTGKGKEQEILLEKDVKLCEEVVVIAYPVCRCGRHYTTTCTKISECTVQPAFARDSTVSISSASAGRMANTSIYPNPVLRNNVFNVELKSERDGVFQLAVFAMNGQQIFMQTQKTAKGQNRISVIADPRWTAGVYIVQIRNEKGTIIKKEKLVVQ